jgi:outer membrane lipoprotein SlyB
VTAPALAGPVTGAAIGAGAGAVVAGPPGAVVGGVAGAVIGGPNLHHRHVYRDSRGRYYWSHHRRHYY